MAPSVEMVCGLRQFGIDTFPLVQVNETVTLELFQPLALGVGKAKAVREFGTTIESGNWFEAKVSLVATSTSYSLA